MDYTGNYFKMTKPDESIEVFDLTEGGVLSTIHTVEVITKEEYESLIPNEENDDE